MIIELKRDVGYLGVETQALQYLADFRHLRGQEFVRRFASDAKSFTESIKAHCGSAFSIDDVNKTSRIILVARDFDPTVYSMGEWLSNQGVPFRCIAYSPAEIEGRQFISFSIKFDQSLHLLFPVSFRPPQEILDITGTILRTIATLGGNTLYKTRRYQPVLRMSLAIRASGC